ncbi:MAG TPA: DUF433 domain-containing protein [Acidobacteriaceae bacterium]|nr:DUF433 domain-containing protein [Acidobacteriaceae bacterium]
MDWAGCELVEVVPGKVSGAPLLKGTRVPADGILENYQAGESVEQIAYNFDLDPTQIQALLVYASAHTVSKRAS